MIDYKLDQAGVTILYTAQESTSPLYLQDLMCDFPFSQEEPLTIHLTVQAHTNLSIIDDLHMIILQKNTVIIDLYEHASISYQLFIANHSFCDQCLKKEVLHCQPIPTFGEKYLTVNLLETHAQATITCHYLSDKTNTFYLSTTQRHCASHTKSNLISKSVLDAKAILKNDNTIVVEKNLYNIEASQHNKNLMNSQTAHVISMPKLLIKSKETTCQHGATISSIPPEDLFYCQSRGLDNHAAKYLLINAFLKQ